MTGKLRVVTIDGPSGVGKSTVSRRLAAELGFTYLDTGAMYRAVGLGCVRNGVNIEDEAAVAAILDNLTLQLLPPETADEDIRVLLNGEDVSREIRTPEAGMLASKVSALPPVRAKLTAMQQAMGRAGKLVADGRDTGTVVFPDAAWKFFLDAPSEERARRRIKQLREQGQEVDEQKVLAQIIKRDQNDRERTIAPLSKADDALLIDSAHLDAEGVVARMLAVIKN